MTIDRTLDPIRRPANVAPDPAPEESVSGGVVSLGAAFLNVALQAMEDCQRGKDAVEEIKRRRNVSGE